MRAGSVLAPDTPRRTQGLRASRRIASHRVVPRAVGDVQISAVLEQLCNSQNLSKGVTKDILSHLVDEGDPAKIAAFLVLLRAKGETASEIAGLASAMKEKMSPVTVNETAVDIVGTGGARGRRGSLPGGSEGVQGLPKGLGDSELRD